MKIVSALALLLLAVEPSEALIGRVFRTAKKTVKDTVDKAAAITTGRRLPPKVLDNKGLDYIFENNVQWRKQKVIEDKDFFKKLGSTHAPEYMYIGTYLD